MMHSLCMLIILCIQLLEASCSYFCDLFCRLTFLVCSVGFTNPMLFDEKKQPYHLMLQKFVTCGGQAALFE